MEDDITKPPETPPGEPTTDHPAPDDQPKVDAKPDAPVFTAEQTAKMVGDAVKGAFKEVFPAKQADTAPESSGPSAAELETQLDQVDNQIDLAVQEGRPSSEIRQLNKKRDQLRDQKFDVERVEPLRAQGSQSINSLVIENLRAKDPLFEKYEAEFMALVGPSLKAGQALTMEVAKEGFALIKGRHMTEIIAAEKEADIRKKKIEQGADLPGGTSGRSVATQPKSPSTIRERFGERADEAFRSKLNKGMDENAFAKRMGYKDKDEWFKKDDELSKDTDGSFGLDR